MAKSIKTWIGKSKKFLLIILLLVVLYNIVAIATGLPIVDISSAFGGVFTVLTALGV